MPAPVQSGMKDYYVNVVSGTIQRQDNPLLAAALMRTGWDGPFTWAEAKADANKSAGGLFQSSGLANKLPSLPNPLSGIQAIGDFFNRLTQANTWIRVGEVGAGLLLLWLGLNAAMRGTAAGDAVQGAKNTAKKAALVTGAAVPK